MALKPVGRTRSASAAQRDVVAGGEKDWGGESPLLAEAVDLLATVAGRMGRRTGTAAASISSNRETNQREDFPPAMPRRERQELPQEPTAGRKIHSSSLGQLRSDARNIVTTAGSNSRQAQVAVVACDLAAQNLKAGTATAKKLTSSLTEVSRRVAQLPTLTAKSVDEVSHAAEELNDTKTALKQLEKLVKGMSGVARQLTTLSFNATMEAARPGVGGNGFAVIAAELQTLSRRLTRSGKMVRRQLDVLQNSTNTAAQAMQSTGGTMQSMQDCAAATHRTITEQKVAAESIARDLADAVNALGEASGASKKLSASAVKCGNMAQQLQLLTERLSSDGMH